MKSVGVRVSIGLAVIIAVVLVALMIGAFRHGTKYCGFSDVILHALFLYEDSTTYSPGFSEESFAEIMPGMDRQQVIALLGEPITKEKYMNGIPKEVWRYTSGTRDRNYWFRTVVFDQQGKVARVGRKYFVD